MKSINVLIKTTAVIFMLSIGIAAAEEQMNMDHGHDTHQHEQMSPPEHSGHAGHMESTDEHSGHAHHNMQAAKKPILKTLPPSGKSREAGYEGSYMMDSTTVENDPVIQCQQASRGLIMLDRAGWEKCGGMDEDVSGGKNMLKSVDHKMH
jgi:hypothetical protein